MDSTVTATDPEEAAALRQLREQYMAAREAIIAAFEAKRRFGLVFHLPTLNGERNGHTQELFTSHRVVRHGKVAQGNRTVEMFRQLVAEYPHDDYDIPALREFAKSKGIDLTRDKVRYVLAKLNGEPPARLLSEANGPIPAKYSRIPDPLADVDPSMLRPGQPPISEQPTNSNGRTPHANGSSE